MTVKRREVIKVSTGLKGRGDKVTQSDIDHVIELLNSEDDIGLDKVHINKLLRAKEAILDGVVAINDNNERRRRGLEIDDMPDFLKGSRTGSRTQRLGDRGLDEVLVKLAIFVYLNMSEGEVRSW